MQRAANAATEEEKVACLSRAAGYQENAEKTRAEYRASSKAQPASRALDHLVDVEH
jgi:hypothetical protein